MPRPILDPWPLPRWGGGHCLAPTGRSRGFRFHSQALLVTALPSFPFFPLQEKHSGVFFPSSFCAGDKGSSTVMGNFRLFARRSFSSHLNLTYSPGFADYSEGIDNNSTGNNSTPSGQGSIFQLFLYPIYLMTKSSVIPYFMAMCRPMMRGNGFMPLPTRGPASSQPGGTQRHFQALPSVDL